MDSKQMGGNMGGHTPGPWVVSGLYGAPEGNFLIWTKAEDHAVAHIFPITHGGKDAESERLANARLIAAAPELLAALENARNWVAGDSKAGNFLREIDAALAKARGI